MKNFETLKKSFGDLQKKFISYFDDKAFLNSAPSIFKKKLRSKHNTFNKEFIDNDHANVVENKDQEDLDYIEQRTKIS